VFRERIRAQSPVPAVGIARVPSGCGCNLAALDWPITDRRSGHHATGKGGGVDKWLECAAHLASSLVGPVKLAVPVVATADKGPDCAGPVIYDNRCALDVVCWLPGRSRHVAVIGLARMLVAGFLFDLCQKAIDCVIGGLLQSRIQCRINPQAAPVDLVLTYDSLQFPVQGVHCVVLLWN